MLKMGIDKVLPKNLLELYATQEEYSGQLDPHGRFLFKFSRNQNVMRPIVSEYLTRNNLLKIDWPEHSRFAACLTHDIDAIYPSSKYSLYTSAKLLSNFRIKEGLHRVISRKQKNSKNPYWNFAEIAELENQYGAKSSFYFKATATDPIGWIYNIQDLREEINYLDSQGFEIGLHGGYYSQNDYEALLKEKEELESVLGKKVIGIRNHFLRFSTPYTWRLLSKLGFKYDTTFGFSDMPGFRNGMCHPFKPYDLLSNSEVNILEIPLVIMDTALFRMPVEEAWLIIKRLIESTEKNHGVITILWHNNTFDEVYHGKWTKLYTKILRFLQEKNAWITSAQQVYAYWTSNYSRSTNYFSK